MSDPKLTPSLQRWLVRWLSLPLLVLNGWVLLVLIDYFNRPLKLLILGSVIAFLLEYPLQWLERHRVKRGLAVLMILAAALVLIGILGVTLVPLLTRQAQDLAANFPIWEQSATQQVQSLHSWLQSLDVPLDLKRATENLNTQLSEQLRTISTQVPGLVAGAIGSIFELFLIIVVVVYLLLKGETVWNGLLDWLPLKLSRRVQTILPRSFRNYFIGQGTIALILGMSMALAFTVFRIPYGFLFGVLIGTLALFPYGGAIGITWVTILLAFKSIGLGLTVLAIATIVDQIVENGIAPRLLGHLTGVHPVWVVVAILMGGKIAGLLGVLLAVPIASTVKEVMEIYKPKRISSNVLPESTDWD